MVGGSFHRLVALASTTVRPGEPFDALVKAEDLWGNPCERFTGTVALRGDGIDGLPSSGIAAICDCRYPGCGR